MSVDALTRAEIVKAFDKYDADRNNVLTKPEFRAILVACGMRDENVTQLFQHVDTNKDGGVNAKEFLNWCFDDSATRMGPKTAADKMDKVHAHIERLNMTPEEALDDWLDFMNELRESAVYAKKRDVIVLNRSNLRKVGKNKDKVEKNEPVTLKHIFDSMDTNNNGKVTMSEFVSGCSRLGIDCEDDMLCELFRVIDEEKTIKKKIVAKGGRFHDIIQLSEEEQKQYITPALTESEEEARKRSAKRENNHLKAWEKREELDKKRIEDLKEQGLDAEYIAPEVEEFKGALKAQEGVTTTFQQKDGMLGFKEFKKAFAAVSAPAGA